MATKTKKTDAAADVADAGAEQAAAPETYEVAREELAAVVERLEAGGLSLDESLALWERGQLLAGACETFLAGARARIEEALAGDEREDG